MDESAKITEHLQGDVSPGRAVGEPPPEPRPGAQQAAPTIHRFELYVAGDAQNAAIALANLTAFCHAFLADCHAIEIVDVFEEPLRALEHRVYMTPTLVVLAPGPVQSIVGTLEDSDALQRTLGIAIEGP